MTDEREHRRRQLFDHANSQRRREKDADDRRIASGKLSPVERLRVAQRDELAALGDKHRREFFDLNARLAREIAAKYPNSASPPREVLTRQDEERRALHDKHGQAREAVLLRHRQARDGQRAQDTGPTRPAA